MAFFSIGSTDGTTKKYDLAFIGTTIALTVDNFNWFTKLLCDIVYGKSSNRQTYVSAAPEEDLPSLQTFVRNESGTIPNVYEFNLKGLITLDDSQFVLVGHNGVQLPTDTLSTDIPDGGNLVTTTKIGYLSLRASNIIQNAPPSNVSLIEYSFNGGPFTTLDVLFANIANQPEADFLDSGIGTAIQSRITRTDLKACSTSLTFYY
jgi:hypothetical protein